MSRAVVIIPTYNERENIRTTIEAVMKQADLVGEWQLHVLVVDDTSPDGTAAEVEQIQKREKRVHLLINPTKAGLGAAYLKGMEYAFGLLKADVIFEFDADLSHDPTKIPALLKKIDAGYDMALGSRYIKGGGIPQDWGLHRKFLSVVGNIVIMVVFTDFRIRDWTSGYRAITKRVYDAVHKELTGERFTGYTFQIGFLYQTVRKGFKVAEVPFVFVDRVHGHSKLGPEYIKNNLLYIFKMRYLEIINNRIFKFAAVGGTGAMVQLVSLYLWRLFLPYQFAFFASIESAVVSNFILNNIWTFSDRKLDRKSLPSKFIQFNLASSGSILIQQAIALVGEFVIGLHPLFTLPFTSILIDTGHLYAVVGILVGMFWNFFAYTKFIWKAGKPTSRK